MSSASHVHSVARQAVRSRYAVIFRSLIVIQHLTSALPPGEASLLLRLASRDAASDVLSFFLILIFSVFGFQGTDVLSLKEPRHFSYRTGLKWTRTTDLTLIRRAL